MKPQNLHYPFNQIALWSNCTADDEPSNIMNKNTVDILAAMNDIKSKDLEIVQEIVDIFPCNELVAAYLNQFVSVGPCLF